MLLQTLFDGTPAGAALEFLQSTYKIRVVEDSPNALVSLKYNQLESPMDNPMVQECRGVVVDISTDHARVLAWPYNKFWNYGEPLADDIDWDTARVPEKLDGSLMILYWHPGQELWKVASSGHPTAGGSFGNDTEQTFNGAFWTTFENLGMRVPPLAHMDIPGSFGTRDSASFDLRRLTFMFELCAAPNRIVVKHDKPRLVLHGIRDLDWGRELPADACAFLAGWLNWEYVKHYPFTSMDEVLAAAAAVDPIQCEGFIVVDARGNRVKIKSPRYVMLHQLKGEFTPRRAIELWQSGDTTELLTHFPEMRPQVNEVQSVLDLVAMRAYDTWKENSGAEDRKTFAAAVKHLPHAAVVFKMLAVDHPSPDDAAKIMRGMTVAALERLVESAS